MKNFINILKSGVLAAIIFIAFACNGQKHTLEFNLEKGTVFNQRMVMDMKIGMEAMGQKIEVATVMDSKLEYKVTDVQNDLMTLQFVYKTLQMDMDMGAMGQRMTISSETDEELATLTNLNPLFRAMINVPITFTVNKEGKVQSVEGFEKFQEAMFNAFDTTIDENTRQQFIAQLESQFSSEMIQNMFEQMTAFLPGKPVAIGDTWNSQIKTSGPVSLDVNMKMKLTKVSDNVATVETTGDISTGIDGGAFDFNGMQLKSNMSGTQKGSMQLDMNTGWPIKSEAIQEIKGETEMGGMKIPQSITTKITLESI